MTRTGPLGAAGRGAGNECHRASGIGMRVTGRAQFAAIFVEDLLSGLPAAALTPALARA